MKKLNLAVAVLIANMIGLSAFASIPNHITDDSKIYRMLTPINVRKELKTGFDKDISRLSAAERNYKERLPVHPRLRRPVERVTQMKYRYSGRPSS